MSQCLLTVCKGKSPDYGLQRLRHLLLQPVRHLLPSFVDIASFGCSLKSLCHMAKPAHGAVYQLLYIAAVKHISLHLQFRKNSSELIEYSGWFYLIALRVCQSAAYIQLLLRLGKISVNAHSFFHKHDCIHLAQLYPSFAKKLLFLASEKSAFRLFLRQNPLVGSYHHKCFYSAAAASLHSSHHKTVLCRRKQSYIHLGKTCRKQVSEGFRSESILA